MPEILPHLSKTRIIIGITRYMFWKTHFIFTHHNLANENFYEHLVTSFRFSFEFKSFRVKLRDGNLFKSHNIYRLYNNPGISYKEFKFHDITIKNSEKKACQEVFSGAYKWLEAKGKIIIDINANVGHSSLFFAIKGAKRVYGYEVNPKLAEIAVTNVKDNGFGGIIEIENSGIGKQNAMINSQDIDDAKYQVGKSESWIIANMNSLRDLLANVNTEKLSLKIDCEGCEYYIILESDCNTLNRFEQIIGEYHYDYPTLKHKLESCGFKTESDKQTYFYKPERERKDCLTGFSKHGKKANLKIMLNARRRLCTEYIW